jgi:hypothetical protein
MTSLPENWFHQQTFVALALLQLRDEGNAGQGYRPNSMTEFAVRLMSAQGATQGSRNGRSDDGQECCDYLGTYVSTSGREAAVIAEGDRLSMRIGSQSGALQAAGDDTFLASVLEWQRFPIVFGACRAKAR